MNYRERKWRGRLASVHAKLVTIAGEVLREQEPDLHRWVRDAQRDVAYAIAILERRRHQERVEK